MMRRRLLYKTDIIPQGSYDYGIFNIPDNQIIDTGICLTDTDKDWSLLFQVSFPGAFISSGQDFYRLANVGVAILRTTNIDGVNTETISFGFYANYFTAYYMTANRYMYNNATRDFININPRRFALWHDKNSQKMQLICNNYSSDITHAFTANNTNIHIFNTKPSWAKPDKLMIYEKLLTQNEINNFILNDIIP